MLPSKGIDDIIIPYLEAVREKVMFIMIMEEKHCLEKHIS